MKIIRNLLLTAVAVAITGSASAQGNAPIKIVKGKVEYTADTKGNRVLDFSYCGYRQSAVNIPSVPVAVVVTATEGDQSKRIQKAIDYVSSLKPDKSGMRGTVLLEEGIYDINNALHVSTSGVVLAGKDKSKTIIRKHGIDRGAAIYLEGKNDRQITGTYNVNDSYVPVNTHIIKTSASLKAGDDIIVLRPSTKEWIESIGCSVFGGGLGYWGWKPGEMDVQWERKVINANADGITIDVPLTVALDKKWGDAVIMSYSWPGRISECGIENLTIESVVDSKNPQDEDHAWDGIYIDAAKDCWVRLVTFRQFAGSAVNIQRGGSQITVEDCMSCSPVSEIGGLRRRTFFTMGGKCLFQRCWSEEGINDFSAGYCAPGPNAFVQCDAVESHSFSGSSSSWATGLLFDNVNIDGNAISFKNLGLDKWGAGWNTANSVMWQCSASMLDCYNAADDARCYSVGCWSYCNGDGYWSDVNNHVNPRSLYQHQLMTRITEAGGNADEADARCRILMRNLEASTSPTLEKAAEMAKEALKPRITMKEWIEEAIAPAYNKAAKCVAIDKVKEAKTDVATAAVTPAIENGVLTWKTSNTKAAPAFMTGSFHGTPWWNGRTRYPYMAKADYAVTRFVPGMECRGGTDRIDSLKVTLDKQNISIWNQNYGLWYDRRRDDHERIRRPNGDVWAPFWEQAIARSGEGKAWDGLSKYDLTKLNRWYMHRVGQLADAKPQMLVINQHYFQHNILEAGAHWVDCPWRNANNINTNHFLEPVPFTGDKRIFTADLFYDVTEKEYAQLHRQYIWNLLDQFADNENVYHSISEEYTGPLHFTKFWLDCIAEWQAKTGKDARVVLNCTYDSQKAIMADKKYAAVVDIVEIEQWCYDSQKLYAPEGGKNLAPRQHLRLTKVGNPGFEDVYRAVSETHMANPDKPVLYLAKGFDRNPWAIVFAGGSCPTLKIKDNTLREAMAKMQPEYATLPYSGIYRMSGNGSELIYNATDKEIPLAKNSKKIAYTVGQRDGSLTPLKSANIPANTIVYIK